MVIYLAKVKSKKIKSRMAMAGGNRPDPLTIIYYVRVFFTKWSPFLNELTIRLFTLGDYMSDAKVCGGN